jgi:cell division protein FtsW
MKRKGPDYILLIFSALLVTLGILILSSVSAALSQENFGYPYYYLVHQLLYGLIPGLILAFIFFKIPLEFLKKISLPLFLLNLIILSLVFIPQFTLKSGGARRWLNLGPISLQPAEFLKITFLLYFSAWLSSQLNLYKKKRAGEKNLPLLVFFVLLGVLGIFLILQPNVGTLSVLFTMALLVYFGSGTPVWQSILIVLVGISGLISLIKIAPYRAARLLVFLRPETDPLGMGYQIKQALIAIGSGGIFGLGLGLSRQKFGFLPQSMQDSIFAIFAEENGFVGAIILILLFLIFVWLGFRVSKKSSDKFSQLLALGVSSWIGVQALVNIGAMIGILPLTGIPLPFISYGGTHLIAELIGIGILLNISRHN